MIGHFERAPGGYRASLDGDHSLLFQQLLREILLVLDDPGVSSPVLAAIDEETDRPAPHDPALGHLLPSMSLEPQEAERMRALTEDFLRAEKSSRLRRVRQEMSRARLAARPVWVDEDDVWDWLAALNDVRLALSGELGLEDQSDAERVERLAMEQEESRARENNVAAVYMMVTWWQGSLLGAMRAGVPTN
ncbi:DUF2017 family protein [Schaalia sp. 19OD2882]|uniref:DUF2017 family protein n=1 Tax=Schaalia sp. 19OD2882 TaxID=2794089 RepID=UPI001C1ECF11|nr:DUF2017 family protein [Schaalia sp. 19OD2882]QWW20179.1 DUF2017 family protein [Schaalia sp. 19OD2882]